MDPQQRMLLEETYHALENGRPISPSCPAINLIITANRFSSCTAGISRESLELTETTVNVGTFVKGTSRPSPYEAYVRSSPTDHLPNCQTTSRLSCATRTGLHSTPPQEQATPSCPTAFLMSLTCEVPARPLTLDAVQVSLVFTTAVRTCEPAVLLSPSLLESA